MSSNSDDFNQSPDSIPFDSNIPQNIPTQQPIEEIIEDLTQAEIDARLEFARFLAKKRFKLQDKHQALQFVARIIHSDLIRQGCIDAIKPEFHNEFNVHLKICMNHGFKSADDALFLQKIAETEDNRRKSQKKIPPREQNYLKIVRNLVNALCSYGISIEPDIDDFILKLVCYQPFRDEIYANLSKFQRGDVDSYCKQLLDNEFKD